MILTPVLMCVLFLPPPSNTLPSAGCPTLHLSSDTTYLEIVSDPTGQGLSPTRLSPPSGANRKSRLSPVLLTLGLKIRGSHDPLLGFHEFAGAAHRTQRNTSLTRLLVLWKGLTQEQPVTEVHRARHGESGRSFHALSRRHSPQISTPSPTRKLSKASIFEFLRRLHYMGTTD